jgi:serine/threonine protein kinase
LICGFPPFFSSEKLKEIDYLSCAPFWFFFNSDTNELRNEIRDGKINFPSPFWDKISDSAKCFVRALLTVSEEQRLTAAEALEHEWIVREIAESKEDDESSSHLLVDKFRDSPELFESLDGLPEIVSTRMQELRALLEQRLAHRPSLQHLRQSGIFRSTEHL